jgi:hypothetical protein
MICAHSNGVLFINNAVALFSFEGDKPVSRVVKGERKKRAKEVS